MKQIFSLPLIFAIGLLLMLWARDAHAQAIETNTFNVASNLYTNGNFSEAIALYEELVNEGYSSTALFYNLGNAYRQSGEIGLATLNYRRALALSPRDGDSRHNLDLTLETAGTTSPGTKPLIDLLATPTNWMRISEVGLFALFLWFVWAGLVWFYLRTRLSAKPQHKQ